LAGLYLITPPRLEPVSFRAVLDAALGAAPVDCLLIAPDAEADLQAVAAALVPVAQARGVAALVTDDTRVAGRVKADGLHVDAEAPVLAEAIRAMKPGRIVGVGGLTTRHGAMEAGERDVDYVFFGRLDRPEGVEAHPHDLDLAAWWVPLFDCPCVVLAGTGPASITEAAATGAEFVAVRGAVWDHPAGAAAGVAAAAERIEEAVA
jgi:thiamine-phosphate pyrophosphorylase